ncbi:MAG TPA: hypothetical protein VK717_00110 [Opitutaceae bacterium]|jgi:hypothetical protein|nr:hypothetical protein [Opitutaceae bacterium]
MAQSEQKLVTPASLAVDAVLTLAVFVYFLLILRSHVQSENPKWIYIWAAYGSACLTGVFWLALQMFRVVLRFQRDNSAKK